MEENTDSYKRVQGKALVATVNAFFIVGFPQEQDPAVARRAWFT
jgi:hypothetical protein